MIRKMGLINQTSLNPTKETEIFNTAAAGCNAECRAVLPRRTKRAESGGSCSQGTSSGTNTGMQLILTELGL